MCLNWKVAAGLVVVALGAWALAPNLASVAVPLLAVALCLGSKLFLMRRMHGRWCTARSTASGSSAAETAVETSVPSLRARLASLRVEERRLAAELARLEADPPPEPGARASAPAAPGRD
jgi:hypothetical protein